MHLQFAILATLAQALHFPGLISKDYPYSAELPIRSSYFYSAKRNRPGFFKRLKRAVKKKNKSIFDFDKKTAIATRYTVSETFDMCSADHGQADLVVADSPIAGYFGYSHRLTTSPF